MPIFAAVCEGEPGRIAEAIGSSVYDFGHHGQRADGAGANTGGEQQFGEVLRISVCCRCQIAMEPSQHHVA